MRKHSQTPELYDAVVMEGGKVGGRVQAWKGGRAEGRMVANVGVRRMQ